MPKLKEALQELFPSQDLERSARSRSGARLVKGQREPEITEANYLPLLSVLLGGVILAMAILKPQNGGVAGLLGRAQNQPLPPQENENYYQQQNWQQQESNLETPWPES